VRGTAPTCSPTSGGRGLYDERRRDYGYIPAWVKKLVKECHTEVGFRKLLGFEP
jgi:hypothetical protein